MCVCVYIKMENARKNMKGEDTFICTMNERQWEMREKWGREEGIDEATRNPQMLQLYSAMLKLSWGKILFSEQNLPTGKPARKQKTNKKEIGHAWFTITKHQ